MNNVIDNIVSSPPWLASQPLTRTTRLPHLHYYWQAEQGNRHSTYAYLHSSYEYGNIAYALSFHLRQNGCSQRNKKFTNGRREFFASFTVPITELSSLAILIFAIHIFLLVYDHTKNRMEGWKICKSQIE